jgi:hypothetical protein
VTARVVQPSAGAIGKKTRLGAKIARAAAEAVREHERRPGPLMFDVKRERFRHAFVSIAGRAARPVGRDA